MPHKAKVGCLFTAILVACIGLWATETLNADDWPQIGGPNRNGISKETKLLPKWGQNGPPVAWKKQVGSGFSAPVIADGKLLLFHQIGNKETVTCMEANTGKVLWQTGYVTTFQDNFGKGEGPRATPVIDNGKVYTLGAEGYLQCLNFKDGSKVWGFALKDRYNLPQNYFGIGTSPVVAGKLLLVNVGGTQTGIVGFRTDNGKEVWRATNHEASYSSPVVAKVAGKELAIFFTRHGVVLLNPGDGKIIHQQRWRAVINASVNAATPLVIGDTLFFSTAYDTGALLLKFDGKKVTEVWKNDESMTNHYNTCVFHNGHLYGIHGRQEAGADLRCVELKTGKVKWTQKRFGCASLILADGKIIAFTEDGELVLFRPTPEGFQQISRADVLDAEPARAMSALSDGRLFVRDRDTLICFDLRDR